MLGERVVESVILEGEVLVEWWDFVDDIEGYDEDAGCAFVS